mgnify:FL=1
MNILYLGGFDLPDKNAAAQRVIANAKALRDLGWNVQLIGLDKQPSSFTYEGFECINLKYPSNVREWFNYLASIKNYLLFLENMQPELVIAYNHPAVALGKLADYCKKRGIKVVSDCTEWYTPEGDIIQKTIKGWDTKKRMTDVHLRMDGIISISRYLHNYYTGRGVKSMLLPPLVDVQDEKWNVRSEIAAADEIVLTYAGSPGHKDALDRPVGIVTDLPEATAVRFEIVGLNRDQFLNAYNYERKLSNRVHFKGRIPHKDTLKLLSESDFQIFIREDNITTKAGFPTKFVESISAGVPVLTNLTSNIGDYLSDGVNGYPLDAANDETLKASLLRVLKQPREAINDLKKSIDRGTFDYRRYVTEIKQFIENI